jgi:hypothetical protein
MCLFNELTERERAKVGPHLEALRAALDKMGTIVYDEDAANV